MALFRPPVAPQVIRAGLAVFLTGASGPALPAGNGAALQAMAAYRGAANVVAATPKAPPATTVINTGASGPTPPAGATAAQQALAAYRGSAHLAAQPWPPEVTATALAVGTGPTAPLGSSAPMQALAAYRMPPWAHAVQEQWRLEPAPAPIGGIAAAFAGRVTVQQSAASAWPYALPAEPLNGPAAVLPVATQISAAAPAQISSAPWPYAAIEEWRLTPQPSWQAGIVAVSTAPPAIALTSAAPWPYGVAAEPLNGPAAVLRVAAQLSAAAPAQIATAPWPYAAIEEWRLTPQPSWQAGIVAVSTSLPGIMVPRTALWGYAVAAEPSIGAAATLAVPALPAAAPVAQLRASAAWPYAQAVSLEVLPVPGIAVSGPPPLVPVASAPLTRWTWTYVAAMPARNWMITAPSLQSGPAGNGPPLRQTHGMRPDQPNNRRAGAVQTSARAGSLNTTRPSPGGGRRR